LNSFISRLQIWFDSLQKRKRFLKSTVILYSIAFFENKEWLIFQYQKLKVHLYPVQFTFVLRGLSVFLDFDSEFGFSSCRFFYIYQHRKFKFSAISINCTYILSSSEPLKQ
jgi:hypothetical protein